VLFRAITQRVVVMTLEERTDRLSRNVGKELPLLCLIAKNSSALFFAKACSEQMKNYFINAFFRILILKLHTHTHT
jgi:hypothetical protein